jgi:transporter family-2 protein
MRMALWLALGFGLLSGALLAAQPGVNGTLARRLQHPLQASVVSFAVGLGVLVLVGLFSGAMPPRIAPGASIPWWAWTGGLIGAVMVTTSLYFAPTTGALFWMATVITGQTLACLLLDHYGLAGYAVQPLTPARIIGALLLIAGVALVCWR